MNMFFRFYFNLNIEIIYFEYRLVFIDLFVFSQTSSCAVFREIRRSKYIRGKFLNPSGNRQGFPRSVAP